MFDVRATIDEELDDFVATLEAGERQRRVAIRLDLSVDVAAAIEEEFDGGRVAVHGGEHERRDAQFAARSNGKTGVYNMGFRCI